MHRSEKTNPEITKNYTPFVRGHDSSCQFQLLLAVQLQLQLADFVPLRCAEMDLDAEAATVRELRKAIDAVTTLVVLQPPPLTC